MEGVKVMVLVVAWRASSKGVKTGFFMSCSRVVALAFSGALGMVSLEGLREIMSAYAPDLIDTSFGFVDGASIVFEVAVVGRGI